MKISCRKKIALNSKKEAILIPVFKNIKPLRQLTGKKIDDHIANILESDYFNFDEKEIKSFYIELNGKLKRVFLVNVPKDLGEYRLYMEMGAQFASILRKDKINSFSVLSFEDICGEKRDFKHTRSFVEGILFGLYSYDVYKSKSEKFRLDELEIITSSTKLKKYADESSQSWLSTFDNVYRAKDLINMPAQDLTPEAFANIINDSSAENFKVSIIDDEEVLEKDFPLVYNVGKGSGNRPRFVTIEYNGNPDSDRHVALVGKGVTFDSGGSNLKPTGSIETMKTDMSGAATVFAVTKNAHDLQMKVNIKAYIPLVENIIGGLAYRPGDVLTSASGKTIEVLNTDAEGRLILADALHAATKGDPEIIIDVATLTGACVVALGSFCAGLFSNRRFLAKNITDISYDIGEDIWELPLLEAYEERIKSDIADLQNISKQKGEAGSTIAGLFLREFVDNWPWIHLDIAGPAFLGEAHPIFGKQATGFGVRLLSEFIQTYYSEQ